MLTIKLQETVTMGMSFYIQRKGFYCCQLHASSVMAREQEERDERGRRRTVQGAWEISEIAKCPCFVFYRYHAMTQQAFSQL